MTALIDDEDRRRAICERDRNVIIDASAGTGKTKLVVDRIVELVAPADGHPPIPIDRLAAITFTRKAAGELRVRTRQQLLEALAVLAPGSPRATPLLHALGGIDTAHIGTIHGFADRLLRKWPAQARLDPRYQLDDDTSRLTDECFEAIVHAVETGTLDDLLRGSSCATRADEIVETVHDAQQAGIRLYSQETEHWTYEGLDALVAGFVLHRDVEIEDPGEVVFDRATFEGFAAELLRWCSGLSADTSGGRWLVETAAIVKQVVAEASPARIYRELVARLERGPRGKASSKPRLRIEFGNDDRAWDAWKAFDEDVRKDPVRARSLREDLLGPLRQWMALRLVRLRPAVLHVYELVKARRQVVDQVDLLLRLRNLLRDDLAIRHACQRLFDHVFVDEFQDTDPLQAEIVLYLCQREATTKDATALAPASGTLTVVGDPKQSIYRFRRADIATYQRVIDTVARSPHIVVRLSSSFRSAPPLVDWINERFADILGVSPTGEPFRHDTGDVYYQSLTAGRAATSEATIHVVPMELPAGGTAPDCRALEATTIARYLRWLVEGSGVTIVDRVTGAARNVRYGDVGVLAIATTNLHYLFEAFDSDEVPYASRGGTLFLRDPLHRRFLLALCALADRDDGVAVAALLRPPFFAVDLEDLARSNGDDAADRAVAARAIVSELRRRRFTRSPGATARALLEETALGRTIVLGPNGAQRLAGLRELCFQVEMIAFAEKLDFDAVAQRMRGWVERPLRLDRPHPVDGNSIRVMTVHQAKGLEFPVVVFWDARASWAERVGQTAWRAERDGRGWCLRLDALSWEEPAGLGIASREKAMLDAERKRLVYVAATRTRDLLVIPEVGPRDNRWIVGRMLGASDMPTVRTLARHSPSAPAAWFEAAAPSRERGTPDVTRRDVDLQTRWSACVLASARERLRPRAFSEASSPRTLWGKKGRFGTVFGETVHLAIGLALRLAVPVAEAVERAVTRTGLASNVNEAIADVTRALDALEPLGVPKAAQYELEYAVAGRSPRGDLVSGYIDLLARVTRDVLLLDFKTDAPPALDEPVQEKYVMQVRGYADVLEHALGHAVRSGLLFTANGQIRWLSKTSEEPS